MELRNVKRYYPEDMPYGEGIQYFRSEDGQDFYDSLDKFTKKYKLCTDPETGVIYSMAEDVSRLYPAGFTVVETDKLPDGFNIEGDWYFSKGKILPAPVDWQQKAMTECRKRLSEAEKRSSDLKAELMLDIIGDADKERLTEWVLYIRALNAMNFTKICDETSFNAIVWPEPPQAI
ncbi:phage tail protein [Escherichia coli]|uniref:tail fiber assembly protein n=1 Tax=Escherichia coli TaxID=562 RepID=UPI001917EBD1|nr:tail fiber assembly protein [Escherichia coli]UMT23334.1 phage tail protein [Escherichia coli]CAD6115244.1 tail fiber assembly protein [Escherichia coli]